MMHSKRQYMHHLHGSHRCGVLQLVCVHHHVRIFAQLPTS